MQLLPQQQNVDTLRDLELATLISNMSSNADYDEVNLRIELGHVFSPFKPGVAPPHESRGIE